MESLYDQDFYQWALKEADLMRQGRLSEIDVENIAEELESMGKSQKRELISRLAVLIMHLLKCQYQPKLRIGSWIETIGTQRMDIQLLIDDSPSLKHEIDAVMTRAYSLAVVKFENETGISKKSFPSTSPYTFDHVMDDDFLPE